ncbi:hypothetical protein [Pseudotabrizicola formosa]|uniref:hypothetical protein n=1 Tax=Pseudotabrizicola formosa TaxID=2030009 RepID=UPI000CD2EB13|nr:hypothetical protein [Pseudotabrizicola formosa]
MKWLRTLILFERGGVLESPDWGDLHQSYLRAIAKIDNPRGSGRLKLREKVRQPNGQWSRNGVNYLKARFLEHMKGDEGWLPEGLVQLKSEAISPELRLYPSMMPHREPVTSTFGGFDFVTSGTQGAKVAIEWETGNISSSHRSMNKLAIALQLGIIQVGVLIVPSRSLYQHLTDRVGNISELSGYLNMWAGMATGIERGLLAVTVVEHDDLTVDEAFPYLTVGMDGRAEQGRKKGRLAE